MQMHDGSLGLCDLSQVQLAGLAVTSGNAVLITLFLVLMTGSDTASLQCTTIITISDSRIF